MYLQWVVLAGLGAAFLTGLGIGWKAKGPARSVHVAEILTQIQRAVVSVGEEIARLESVPPLNKITLTLQTVFMEQEGGAIHLPVFTLAATEAHLKAQAMILNLTPPRPDPKSRSRVLTEDDPAAKLRNAIMANIDGLRRAWTHPPPVELDHLSIRVSFCITEQPGMGGGFAMTPFSAGFSENWAQSDQHLIELQFGNYAL